MSARGRAVAELGLACLLVLGCGLAWSAVRSTVSVGPVAEGEPVTTSVVYDPPFVLLTLLSAAAAGALAVVGAARLRGTVTRNTNTP